MAFTPLTIYFLYFVFSRPESQLCTLETRADTCVEEEWNPVCALYTGPHCNSPTGFCYKTLIRTCDACLDSNILGYAPGECEEPTFPKLCDQDQIGASCSDDEEEPQAVCGYSRIPRPERLRGKNSVSKAFSSECEACRSEQSVFNIIGDCKDSSEIGICKHNKGDSQCSQDSETLCAYYTGAGCDEKMCRKTVTQSGCDACGDSSVLFYVKGSCEFVEVGSEDVEELILDDLSDHQELPIPELEVALQEDGTYAYEEVKPEKQEIDDVEPQDYIPELEAVVQEDGSVLYEEVQPQEQKNVIELDCVVEQQDDIPELEAVIQEDGSTIYELATKTETVEEPQEISIMHKKADTLLQKVMASIPELEVALQEDGTYAYEEVQPNKSEIDDVEPQDYIPELEAVIQEDGSTMYEEVNPQEQEDGVVLCIEITPSNEEVEPFVPNEEASNEETVVREDESQLDEPQQVETIEIIETRLLVEPDN